MYILNFISNNEECYWYEIFDKLIDAVRAAHEYGTPNDIYEIYNEEHQLVIVGMI